MRFELHLVIVVELRWYGPIDSALPIASRSVLLLDAPEGSWTTDSSYVFIQGEVLVQLDAVVHAGIYTGKGGLA